jgi:ABC-type cobalamin/Fe3+-siderophores transport system ATPase subunit
VTGPAPLLEAREVVVSRGPREVLHGVSLALGVGEAVALVGPNAAGKSTLVRTLAGLQAADRGEVRLEGRPLSSWSREAVARAVALVAPDEDRPPALTVRERVALGRYPHRGPFRPLTAEDEAAVDRALEQTGIAALAHRRLGTLSAGERQLAALARGLAQEPRVLLLDEPGAHLDIGHVLALFRVLDGVRACGVAVLAVVHDLPRAAAWAPRMALLAAGRLQAEGAPSEVLAGGACARAFGVRIRGHAVAGLVRPLYDFEEVP